jgi:hypothetical protein
MTAMVETGLAPWASGIFPINPIALWFSCGGVRSFCAAVADGLVDYQVIVGITWCIQDKALRQREEWKKL